MQPLHLHPQLQVRPKDHGLQVRPELQVRPWLRLRKLTAKRRSAPLYDGRDTRARIVRPSTSPPRALFAGSVHALTAA